MRLFHKVLSLHKNVLNMNEHIRHTTAACLSPKQQANNCAILAAVLKQSSLRIESNVTNKAGP